MAPLLPPQQQQKQRRGRIATSCFSLRDIVATLVLIALAAQVLVWNAVHRRHNRQEPRHVTSSKQENVEVDSVSLTTQILDIPSKRIDDTGSIAHAKLRPVLLSRKEELSKKVPRGRLARRHRDDASANSMSSNNNATTAEVAPLPEWIQSYLRWHKLVRQQFPGDKLFLDPRAPPLLIRTCLGICGGLNDRLGQLPWDMYVANQTKRVLLLHWHRPVPIRHFLRPNVVDWTADTSGVPGFGPPSHGARTYTRDEMKLARSYPELFEGYPSDRPDDHFWNHQLDAALERATTGEFRNHKVLRFNLLGHIAEDQLERRLQRLGESDTLHWTPSFGTIFRAFFRPSQDVQNELDSLYRSLGLFAGHYVAVHCRVRHPKAHPSHAVVLGKNAAYNADKSGLPWEGETKRFAIATATQALRCAETLLQRSDEPMVFLSDSSDLARYMSAELAGSNATSVTMAASAVESMAHEVVKGHRVVSTPAATSASEVAHIDKNKGREPHEYYSTFVDFYAAVQARCVTYGVGFYALFAAKVSGTSCRLLYRQEAWGLAVNKTIRTRVCSINANESSLVSQ